MNDSSKFVERCHIDKEVEIAFREWLRFQEPELKNSRIFKLKTSWEILQKYVEN